jgi:hypothetical protein
MEKEERRNKNIKGPRGKPFGPAPEEAPAQQRPAPKTVPCSPLPSPTGGTHLPVVFLLGPDFSPETLPRSESLLSSIQFIHLPFPPRVCAYIKTTISSPFPPSFSCRLRRQADEIARRSPPYLRAHPPESAVDGEPSTPPSLSLFSFFRSSAPLDALGSNPLAENQALQSWPKVTEARAASSHTVHPCQETIGLDDHAFELAVTTRTSSSTSLPRDTTRTPPESPTWPPSPANPAGNPSHCELSLLFLL